MEGVGVEVFEFGAHGEGNGVLDKIANEAKDGAEDDLAAFEAFDKGVGFAIESIAEGDEAEPGEAGV